MISMCRDLIADWWRARPLALKFGAYLVVYLATATALTAGITSSYLEFEEPSDEFEVVYHDGQSHYGVLYGGPYIYDAEKQDLVPAAKVDFPHADSCAVYLATPYSASSSEDGAEVRSDVSDNQAPDGEAGVGDADEVGMVYANLESVRKGSIKLFDWGEDYADWYPLEEYLDEDGCVPADRLAQYDVQARRCRMQSADIFDDVSGVDFEGAFGENAVSNTAYYAGGAPRQDSTSLLRLLFEDLTPFVVYGGMAWAMFRRFYRKHINQPLEMLAGAADRIAAQDLDFHIETVPGRELGQLSETLESMRMSLLDAQRELWRTAEDRRRLNAAFAHDLRTPVTVLKGTVEMAQMQRASGGAVDEASLDTLEMQVERLERYAAAMGGLTKLEERPVRREEVEVSLLVKRLESYAREIVGVHGAGLHLDVRRYGGAVAIENDADECAAVTVSTDIQFVEEVLGNVLDNACRHAVGVIEMHLSVANDALAVRVVDDGAGFTPEALQHGCDAYFSENKSSEHFGLGLNVSRMLCELHGGKLTLSNDPLGGACVIAVFGLK